MKARSLNDIRKEVQKEEREKYLRERYRWMTDNLQTAIEHTTVCALGALERLGYSDEELKKFFEEIIFVYNYPPFRGKELKAEDLKRNYEKKLGVDFSKIITTFESEDEFVKKYK